MSDAHKNIGIRITSDTTSITQPESELRQREVPMPLRLLLVADLAPEVKRNWRGESLVRSVDANGFAKLMAEWQPTLRLGVPNHLSSEPKALELSLRFTSLKDFTPGGLARQVPALARLLAIRTEVYGVRTKGTDRETFRARLAEAGVDEASADGLYAQLTVAPPTPAPPKPKNTGEDAALDRLMGMVDAGADGAEEPKSIGDAIAGAVSGDEPRVAASAADTILADFDRKLGGQLRAILEHPGLRRLEAAWRGLKFLADRLPLRDGVHLDVLPAGRDDLSEALYEQVLLPEHSADDGRAPLSAVLLGFAFGNSQADVALLDDLAGTGASLQVPIIASVDPGFFGLGAPEAEEAIPLVSHLVEGPDYIHWNKLREKDEARFVALAFPPLLLRAPYGPDNPSKEVPLDEEGFLWGGGALAVGVAMGASFAGTGWPTHLAGQQIGNLPIRPTKRGQTPLARLLPEAKAAELAEAGFAVLAGHANGDTVRLVHAPNLSKPQRFDDLDKAAQAAAHATLACGLFATRAGHRLLQLPGELDPADTLEAKQDAVAQKLQTFLGAPGAEVPADAVTVEPVPDAEIDGHDLLAVRLQPPRHVLYHPVHLAVGLPVPRA
ncbi:MAG: type VI secretion system contractile sheath large subunit [Bacteroidota bacterium]